MLDYSLVYLPPYLIDSPFVTAVRQGQLGYILQRLHSNHLLIRTYFYFESNNVDFGIHTDELRPPLRCLFTPLGLAVFYKQVQLVQHLLNLEAPWDQAGVIVDCPLENPQERWKVELYRIQEAPIISLTRPLEACFKCIMQKMNSASDMCMRFRLCTANKEKVKTEVVPGVWQLFWLFYKPMQKEETLVQLTRQILQSVKENPAELFNRMQLINFCKTCFHISVKKNVNKIIKIEKIRKFKQPYAMKLANLLDFLFVLHNFEIAWDETLMSKELHFVLAFAYFIFSVLNLSKSAEEVVNFANRVAMKSKAFFMNIKHHQLVNQKIKFYNEVTLLK